MDASEQKNKCIKFELTRSEALVLFEWLARFASEDRENLFQHLSEQQVLFNLEACLEKLLVEPFDENYLELLKSAQEKVFTSDAI